MTDTNPQRAGVHIRRALAELSERGKEGVVLEGYIAFGPSDAVVRVCESAARDTYVDIPVETVAYLEHPTGSVPGTVKVVVPGDTLVNKTSVRTIRADTCWWLQGDEKRKRVADRCDL
jgi:hypothetical protein